MPQKWNHAYDFAFEVVSDREDGEDVTPAMLQAACRARLDEIAAAGGSEILQACGLYDTYAIEGTGEES